MVRPSLSLGFSPNPRSRPVLSGTVPIEGVDLTLVQVPPAELFWRQLSFAQFDISEMSISSLLVQHAHGDCEWVAVPIFSTRHFFHTWAWKNVDAGIDGPQDLRGKRIGVPEYQQTAAVWARGFYQHQHGITAADVEWFMGRSPDRSHGGSTAFQPPEGVVMHYIERGKNLSRMLVEGELDVILMHLPKGLLDGDPPDIEHDSRAATLFPDNRAEGIRYFNETGIYPMNHTVVVRRSIVEKHPWLPLNVFNAFAEAKAIAIADAAEAIATYADAGFASLSLDGDPIPYGVKDNLPTLEALTQYEFEQGLTNRRVALDEVFDHTTLHL